MGRHPGRSFSRKPPEPCPRCYAPLDKGECHSKGCLLQRRFEREYSEAYERAVIFGREGR